MSRIRFRWFALLLLLTSALPVPAARRAAPPALPGILEGQATQVADGDMFTLTDDAHHAFRIRILGIDAPELAQPFGKVSRQVLVNRILHQRLQVLVQSRDHRGLVLGKVMLDGQDLGLDLVRIGMAWHDPASDRALFAGDPDVYAHAEEDARGAHLGLWDTQDPVAPWTWRRAHGR